MTYITAHAADMKLRPDHKLVYMDDWSSAKDRLAGMNRLLGDLKKLAA